MTVEIDVNMQYALGDDPMVRLTIEAAHMAGQTVLHDQLDIENATLTRVDGEGGLGQRIWARVDGGQLNLRYRASVEVAHPHRPLASLRADLLHHLPGHVMASLRPSRFCQSDLFRDLAAQNFGDLAGGQKIAAIRDWVSGALRYVPGSSNAETSAVETFAIGEGVCRDYAHMVCALARASNIPARYVSVYGPDVNPPDFHAVAQVWLEGGWHMVDATGMSSDAELVVIAAGRDASDIAFMETLSMAEMISQTVSVQIR
ncbi:transglutaminase family protein [Seohaeicola saemankumensis]|uniref:Transglutaminase family protein n=1 Tax=Seohaeicola saemankumensis TaxID=481181 RepID=A0ABW3TFV8_9RHOB